MAKEDFIQDEGIVIEALPNANFRVGVASHNEPLLCHLSGKMRKNFIRVLPGDRVLFEMSPYDLTKGRITRRLKPGEEGIPKTISSETMDSVTLDQLNEAHSKTSPEEKTDAS